MSKEKQIEEMSNDLCACHTEFESGVGEIYTDYDTTARKMFAKGYRKQSEGEWGFDGMSWTCSECGEYAPVDKYRQTRHTDFCPNCGARMKGGE